jgi:hypothetical protein
MRASLIEALPPEVREGLGRMAMDGVHFAPVRHHSPACALALQAMVRELRPAAILIEGPDSFDALLPLLHDDRTRPPVAILSQAHADTGEDGAALRSAFFPFCDYSPEWVALRLAGELGADAAFIDLPWQARADDDGPDERARSLMAERYLAHSTYLRALAAASGCRDQDELWDHLFELRSAAGLRDWRTLFADVFAYCALARAGYEAEVLEAEGSLARERHMAAHIRRRRAALAAAGRDGPIVVVSGGFHTLALQQMLAAPEPAPHKKPQCAPAQAATSDWLIRYSFDRLDALNGYAAGMPSPAWHQWVWDSAQLDADGPHLDSVAAGALARLARQGRERGLAEQLSTADVQAALLQALRLAALRGHAGPGREDVLDAMRSCFIKGALDEGNAGFAADLHRFLGGSALGDIPPSSGSPPLLEDARRRARSHGIRLDDSTPRNVRLDLYRKEGHRRRSRFLHLMDYLGAGLGQWRGGPDFLAGSRLELLIEEWQVAWNPLVEARLIELAADGSSLPEAALARLRREEAALGLDGRGRSAGAAVRLLVRACLVGLHERLPQLLDLVARHLATDPELDSVSDCAHQLLGLWRARAPLGVQDHAGVRALLLRAWAASLALLPGLAAVKAEQEADGVRNLVALRAIRTALAAPEAAQEAVQEAAPASALDQAWHAALERLADGAGPGIALAAGALLFLDGAADEARLAAVLAARFGPGADAAEAVRALGGLMAAAPELLLTRPALQADLDRIMGGWDDATFLHYLPDLRLAFAGLKPQETARLATALAQTHAGLDDALAAVHYGVSEEDMGAGAALEAALAGCLRRDGLADWMEVAP